ncbi:hypothetical protein HD597_004061 [Nonomuraea thailandensis]|uniref:Uncharacterized protein n=1 Tax=Nonomuraea thailandensis TaxID=1188745 RepID=A0A9X2K4X9_9ACTN|nr:hypothetical protein [Nonomuraea thailandensis]MCP2357041.1 hypothetical protein [Nonomuraea thailandensis]
MAVRLTAPFRAGFRPVAADLGHVRRVSNEKARRLLDLRPRSSSEAIVASAESMIAQSPVKA